MQHIEVLKSTYLDSVSLMRISKVASAVPGVKHAVVSMGTDTNLGLMQEIGFRLDPAGEVSANDLVIALDARTQEALDQALKVVREELRGGSHLSGGAPAPRSLAAATREHPEIDLVLISVPGRFAAYEARQALTSGRHVMIFSDNVAIEDERELKEIGIRQGLLVMGPDCGTAVISGVGLGFANDLPHGKIGIVSASGTGAQEVSSILARLDIGVSHIIGTGGRDIYPQIGGAMMKMGLEMLIEDDSTETIVMISKAPDPVVGKEVLGLAATAGKPCIVYFAGRGGGGDTGNLTFTGSLTETAFASASAAGKPFDKLALGDWEGAGGRAAVPARRSGRFLRGLFSGGTLAQEALFLLGPTLGPIHTNMHVEGFPVMPDPASSEGHAILDLGDDVFTRGRAHPMIDQAQRLARLTREALDPDTAVILLDVVLGYGCNPDPGGEIAGALTSLARGPGAEGRFPPVVASVCGTHGDPQRYERQKRALESVGVIVAPTNARACEVAGGLFGGGSRG
jgi:FdrA protein